jgi:DNA-binding response OmpR family regulator
MILSKAGYDVVSALYESEALASCNENADLMILGHSVPHEEKRKFIQTFRQHSDAPVLSLLRSGQQKIPEATVGVESMEPRDLIRVVQEILSNYRM